MKEPIEVYRQPDLENASLIVGWQNSSGNLGSKVVEYLSRHLQARTFGEIEPVQFFPLNGVEVENNIAKMPFSRFSSGDRKDLVIFESEPPSFDKYRFLKSVLDTGEYYCKIKDLYTIDGIVSPISHTSPRRLWAVYSDGDFQKRLRDYELENITWEGPPTLSSFLLWLAQNRGIPGLSLWPEISFYLSATEDPKAVKSVLSFFNRRFDLGLDFGDLDSQIKTQNGNLALLRKENPEIDDYISTLEVGLSLNEDDQLKLAQGVTEFLEKMLV